MNAFNRAGRSLTPIPVAFCSCLGIWALWNWLDFLNLRHESFYIDEKSLKHNLTIDTDVRNWGDIRICSLLSLSLSLSLMHTHTSNFSSLQIIISILMKCNFWLYKSPAITRYRSPFLVSLVSWENLLNSYVEVIECTILGNSYLDICTSHFWNELS